MIVISDLKDTPPIDGPCALSIGNFDGFHLGHQAVLNRARQLVAPHGLKHKLVVLTFSNHPSEFFNPCSKLCFLSTPEHKLKLMQDHGVDLVISLPFNRALSEKPFDKFLKEVKDKVPFSYLVLGDDACFGKNRAGGRDQVMQLGNLLSYSAEYLGKYDVDGTPVSSGVIRECVNSGNLPSAGKYLGRPYSVVGLFSTPPNEKKTFYAETISVSKLCLPPPGEYQVHVKTKGRVIAAKAHISKHPLLFSITLDQKEKIAPSSLFEVIFSN